MFLFFAAVFEVKVLCSVTTCELRLEFFLKSLSDPRWNSKSCGHTFECCQWFGQTCPWSAEILVIGMWCSWCLVQLHICAEQSLTVIWVSWCGKLVSSSLNVDCSSWSPVWVVLSLDFPLYDRWGGLFWALVYSTVQGMRQNLGVMFSHVQLSGREISEVGNNFLFFWAQFSVFNGICIFIQVHFDLEQSFLQDCIFSPSYFHFQCGYYVFRMERSAARLQFSRANFPVR